LERAREQAIQIKDSENRQIPAANRRFGGLRIHRPLAFDVARSVTIEDNPRPSLARFLLHAGFGAWHWPLSSHDDSPCEPVTAHVHEPDGRLVPIATHSVNGPTLHETRRPQLVDVAIT
jgi:hypothetical protein